MHCQSNSASCDLRPRLPYRAASIPCMWHRLRQTHQEAEFCAQDQRASRRGKEMRVSIRSGVIRCAMIAVSVGVLCGCAASGSSDSSSSSDTTTESSSSSGTTSSPTQSAPATASAPAPPGPLQTVKLYWHDIGAKNYAAAYRYLARGSVTQNVRRLRIRGTAGTDPVGQLPRPFGVRLEFGGNSRCQFADHDRRSVRLPDMERRVSAHPPSRNLADRTRQHLAGSLPVHPAVSEHQFGR